MSSQDFKAREFLQKIRVLGEDEQVEYVKKRIVFWPTVGEMQREASLRYYKEHSGWALHVKTAAFIEACQWLMRLNGRK